ncbi:MAG: undecaprenyl-diphosphatase, partial [Myxococcales bacterium]|nr:undecaprenyl-diphosphatase [Myxococcales bacterium]
MTIGQAIAFGLVQGISEFLPISSDGHLAVAAFLFGIEDMPLSTVVFVHAGTLLATLLVLRRDIVTLLEGAIRLRRQ